MHVIPYENIIHFVSFYMYSSAIATHTKSLACLLPKPFIPRIPQSRLQRVQQMGSRPIKFLPSIHVFHYPLVTVLHLVQERLSAIFLQCRHSGLVDFSVANPLFLHVVQSTWYFWEVGTVVYRIGPFPTSQWSSMCDWILMISWAPGHMC